MMAYGVYKAAKEEGRSVGKDLSVVGFDDLRFSSMLEVPLTTIRQPVSEIAARAVDILLNYIKAGGSVGDADGVGGLTPPSLVVRESVANLNSNKKC